jgi:hypothetical protein
MEPTHQTRHRAARRRRSGIAARQSQEARDARKATVQRATSALCLVPPCNAEHDGVACAPARAAHSPARLGGEPPGSKTTGSKTTGVQRPGSGRCWPALSSGGTTRPVAPPADSAERIVNGNFIAEDFQTAADWLSMDDKLGRSTKRTTWPSGPTTIAHPTMAPYRASNKTAWRRRSAAEGCSGGVKGRSSSKRWLCGQVAPIVCAFGRPRRINTSLDPDSFFGAQGTKSKLSARASK